MKIFKSIRYILTLVYLVVLSGCFMSQNSKLRIAPQETVLSENVEICALAENEEICIKAQGPTKRIISWADEKHSLDLVPRTTRWHGKLGMTEPNQPNNLWKTKNGVMRVLMTEAQIHYKTTISSVERLGFYRENGYNVAYNDTGILVMWRKSKLPDHYVLDLSVFQIVINGEKPNKLPGSNNDDIIYLKNR